MNEIIPVTTIEQFQDFGDLFEAGFKTMVDPKGGGFPKLHKDDFMRVLVCAALDRKRGTLRVLVSKNKKPLGYVCVVDNSSYLKPRLAQIFSIYTTGRCPSALEELAHEARVWAGAFDFKYLGYELGRVSTTARRFAGRKLKLNRLTMFLSEPVVV